ncbi:unnamed protein product [Paramecium sonneborni]|uniref:Uncharacterized protein n=1 Tax=Paramecium sonneborni TaxID=65129 RepID=A0A8S1RDV6_9CILI|nr:unnamed protein product [Paramecium sonneborni]
MKKITQSLFWFYFCLDLIESVQSLEDVNPLNFVNEQFKPSSQDDTNQTIKGANQYITKYTLNAFTLTELIIDLRHLDKYIDEEGISQFNYTQDDWNINIDLNDNIIELPNIFEQSDVEKVSDFKFIIFAFKTIIFQIGFQLNSKEFYAQKYQFMNTTKIQNMEPKTAIANTNSIFVFQLSKTDQIALPANILPLNKFDYQDHIISYSSNNFFQQNQYTTYSPQSKYWGDRDDIVIPYIPFFSNCQGFGQYIYLYQLIEHANCTLYNENETEAINPFQFSMSPISDECNELKLYCIMDEKYNINPRLPRWFELNGEETLFYIQADPLNPNDFNSDYKVPSSKVVEIQTANSIPSGMMPLEVNLDIHYYQVTKTQKRIIAGSVTFTNFYKLSEDQKAGKAEITYNLIFNFISMTQGQLVNNFALEWPVYFILYMIIGAILTMEGAIFLFYHYITNRNRPRPKINLLIYVRIFWISSLYGICLAFVPALTVFILISIIMAGKLWNTDLSLSCNMTPYSESDDGCAIVFFDLFKNQQKYTSDEFVLLRNARCGIAMITVGLYIVYFISGIYIPEINPEEDYNGNVKNVRLWKRSRILYCLAFITTIILIMTQFSYSDLFANNAYMFLIFLKILQMILEYILEVYFDNNLISSPIGVIFSTYINVATMGNPTFYEFLLSTIVDKGIEMVERAYVIKIQDFVTEELEQQFDKVYKMLKRLLDEEEEDFELEDEKLVEMQKVLKTNEDDSDSDIVFSDDGKENLASDDESFVSNKISSNNHENSFTKEDLDEFENKFRTYLLDQHHKTFQQYNEEQGNHLELAADNEDQTDLIDYFSNFANDIITLVFNPFITTIMWFFYDESNLLADYQINKSEFIYYFLWTIILIPFQMIIDTFGYNLVEQYHQLDFLTYIKNTRERFRNRNLFWKASEFQNDLNCETCFRSLDQWCYSSQFYFITTLQVCAIQMIIFGSHIIYVNKYNIFNDEALIFIIFFWVVVAFFLHHLFIEIGKRLKIWDISNRVSPQDEQVMSSIGDIDKLSTSQIPSGPILLIPNWNLAIEFREQTERLSEINNNFQDFTNDHFKNLFVTSNKQWLADNIQLILSPKTLKQKRKIILDKFNSIYGPLEKKNEEDPVAGFDNAWNFRQFAKNSQRIEMARTSPQKFNKRIDNMSEATKEILKYWLYRSRNMKTAIKYIGGLLEKITKPFCEYCGLNWGLGVDTETRIEDIYLRFLKQKGLKQISLNMGTEIDDWQNFFPKQCRFRTTCFICNVFMVEEMQKDKVKLQGEQKLVVQKKKNKYTLKKVANLILIMIKFIDMAQKLAFQNQ